MKKNGLDGAIVTTPLEVFFFSGFHQDRTNLLITGKEVFAFLPKMFLEHFRETAPYIETAVYENIHHDTVAKIRSLKLRKVVFDPETETYTQGKFWLSQGLKERSGLVQSLRLIKEGEELENVRKACRIAAKTFGLIKPRIKAGVTEREIALEMEYMMQKMGASAKSFELIVAFGPNSALPHHETSARKLKKNEAVLLDFGCVYGRYCSDITRTFFYGKPDAEFLKVYDIVDKAQKAGVKCAKAGLPAVEVDKVCRDYIAERGYGQYFTHGTGHGVGLQIHEGPYLNTRTKSVLKTGMTVTVEPGVYLYGKFGVRIEDTVRITGSCAEVLTR